MLAARAALAVLAVLVLGWTGILLRDFEVGHSLVTFHKLHLSKAERAQDVDRLRDAQLLDPDSNWRLARAGYYLISGGSKRAAARIAEDVVRDEPENVAAWRVLQAATRDSDRARAARASAEIKRLDPLGRRGL